MLEKRHSSMPSAKQSKATPLPAPPLPGGYKVGEKLYFIGARETVSTGDRVVHGEQGEVMGPGTGELASQLAIKFPNNKGNVGCSLDNLSRSPPAK